jgi:glycosyltransferase involved in cell wall biosynthesis
MPYLPEAVESILKQTMEDFEFVVVNDGSTDGSYAYLTSVRDPRLRVVSQSNMGPGASANSGIALAHGKYIARMDADDVCPPTRLERQVQFLAENPDVVLLGTQVAFLVNGRTLKAPHIPLTHEQIVRRFYAGRVGLCNASLMCSADLAKATRYRIQGSGEDVDFALRLAEKGRCANLPETLYLYRIHPISASMGNPEQVRRGARFSVVAAQARRAGKPELSFEDFCRQWSQRGPLLRFRGRLDDWAFILYRQSIIDRATGKWIQGSARLGCAGLCRPVAVAQRLMHSVVLSSGWILDALCRTRRSL